jgi:Mlc titration factor MtfA (ptsG expression regulator)
MLLYITCTASVGYVVYFILLLGILVLILLLFKRIVGAVLDALELLYAKFTKRPLYVHFYPFKKRLNANQIHVLENRFNFYKRLEPKHKVYFQHRLAVFLKQKKFKGKDGFVITEEVKVLVAATAVMLTFGFRNYTIRYVKHIFIYPTIYYSQFTRTTNKGEYNARLKTLVLSWDNFLEGYSIENDKLNLGIHEFAHAIHINSIKSQDINAILFVDTFSELRAMLAHTDLKSRLQNSNFIRPYGFTNDSEFLAVILETFIETPYSFKKQFPKLYRKVNQMLNYSDIYKL